MLRIVYLISTALYNFNDLTICNARGQHTYGPARLAHAPDPNTSLFQAMPGRGPWVKAQPPDAHRRAHIQRLAPDGGHGSPFHWGRLETEALERIKTVFLRCLTLVLLCSYKETKSPIKLTELDYISSTSELVLKLTLLVLGFFRLSGSGRGGRT